jgi:Flp pilus assembly protein TadG
MLRSRQRSQAVVEFGIIALLFTLLMFAVIDFGLLLNTWLAVSSGSREIARSAAVGKTDITLKAMADHLNVPAVSTAGLSGGMCCGPSDAIEVRLEYLNSTCLASAGGCTAETNILPQYTVLTVGNASTSCGAPCHPQADDLVRVTVIAHGAQVITPLVRPFFGCTNGSNPDCHVELHSTTTMRFEGQEF